MAPPGVGQVVCALFFWFLPPRGAQLIGTGTSELTITSDTNVVGRMVHLYSCRMCRLRYAVVCAMAEVQQILHRRLPRRGGLYMFDR